MSTSALPAASRPVDDDRAPGRAIHEFVHKVRESSCLVREWHRAGTDRFVLHLQDTAAIDPFFRPDAASVDLMTVGEVVRQTGLLLAHVGYAVPADWSFVMTGLSAHVDGAAPPLGRATAVVATCTPQRSPTGSLRSMVIDLDLARNGRACARGQGLFNVVSPRVYRRMRPAATAVEHRSTFPRIAPRRVGRSDPTDVVLGRDGSGSLRISVDTGHPVYFDHPGDHLPGMVALEAARQAYVLRRGGEPGSFTARFDRYLELQPEPELSFSSCGPDDVIDLGQSGSAAVRVTMTGSR